MKVKPTRRIKVLRRGSDITRPVRALPKANDPIWTLPKEVLSMMIDYLDDKPLPIVEINNTVDTLEDDYDPMQVVDEGWFYR